MCGVKSDSRCTGSKSGLRQTAPLEKNPVKILRKESFKTLKLQEVKTCLLFCFKKWFAGKILQMSKRKKWFANRKKISFTGLYFREVSAKNIQLKCSSGHVGCSFDNPAKNLWFGVRIKLWRLAVFKKTLVMFLWTYEFRECKFLSNTVLTVLRVGVFAP